MSANGAPLAPREWIGADEFPWPAASSLGEGDAIIACYCVVDVQSLMTRHQKPYLKLQLTDSFGPIEARVWEDAARIEEIALPGAFVGVRGRVEIFNGMRCARCCCACSARRPRADGPSGVRPPPSSTTTRTWAGCSSTRCRSPGCAT